MTISPREARSRIEQLQQDIRKIETQLSDRDKKGKTGKRLTAKQFAAWRTNALTAMSSKLAELRDLKATVQEHRHRVIAGAVGVSPGDPDSLLEACYRAHESLKAKVGSDNIPPDCLAVFDLVRDYVLVL